MKKRRRSCHSKKNQSKANHISDELLKVNFFKGNIPDHPVIIAVPRDTVEQSNDPYVLGIMTKKVNQLCNENVNEYITDGIKKRKIIKKGTWCVTVKFLHKMNDAVGDFYIPVKAKEIIVPINDIYFPGKDTFLDRESYVTCAVCPLLLDSGQSVNIYTPESTVIDTIRASLSIVL